MSFLCLASFPQHDVSKVHPHCTRQDFILFMAEEYRIVGSACSSVDGHGLVGYREQSCVNTRVRV